MKDCVVHFGNGSRAAGVTFVWNGDMSLPRELLYEGLSLGKEEAFDSGRLML